MLNEKEIKECKAALDVLGKYMPKIKAIKQIEEDKNNPCCNSIDSGCEKIAEGVKDIIDSAKSI